MNIISSFVDFVVHLDKYLGTIVDSCGVWAYVVFFLIVFVETGLVVFPFLPGDSLLFALGMFAATDSLNIFWLFVVLLAAAIIGDTVNYAIGKYVGLSLLAKKKRWFIKEEHINKTHDFFKKHGAKTIVLARFVPIVRTFAPFVAGIGEMSYPKFFAYNVIGGLLWVSLFLLGGFYFGNFQLVKENFNLVMILIVVVSFVFAVDLIRKSRR